MCGIKTNLVISAGRPQHIITPFLFFIMVDWEAKLKRANELTGGLKVKHGEIIEYEMIDTIEEKEHTFTDDKTGQPRVVIRFHYLMPDKTVVVPISLHKEIMRLKTENPTLKKIKVYVEGQGLKTRYSAVPIIN